MYSIIRMQHNEPYNWEIKIINNKNIESVKLIQPKAKSAFYVLVLLVFIMRNYKKCIIRNKTQ